MPGIQRETVALTYCNYIILFNRQGKSHAPFTPEFNVMFNLSDRFNETLKARELYIFIDIFERED